MAQPPPQVTTSLLSTEAMVTKAVTAAVTADTPTVTASSTSIRIWIVDDSLMNRKLHRKLIEAEASKFLSVPEISVFPDGEDVVDAFEKRFDEAMAVDCIMLVNYLNEHCHQYYYLSLIN